MPAEVKVAESWTLEELEAPLKSQLCRNYLRAREGRQGILLESAEFSVVSNLLLTRVAGGTRRQHRFTTPQRFSRGFLKFRNHREIRPHARSRAKRRDSGFGFSRESDTLKYFTIGLSKSKASSKGLARPGWKDAALR